MNRYTQRERKTFQCMECKYKFYRRGTPRRCPMCHESVGNPQPTPDGTILLTKKETKPHAL